MLVDTIKATNPEKFFPGTNPVIIESAKYFQNLKIISDSYVYIGTLLLGLIFSTFSLRKISVAFRARQAVEKTNVNLLILCSTIAIITTIGIIFSLIFEALRFSKRSQYLIFYLELHGVLKQQLGKIRLQVRGYLGLFQFSQEHS